MHDRLTFAIETARRAGQDTLHWFQDLDGFDLKSDLSPVTAGDKAAERLIRYAIANAFPGDEILGEEEGGKDVGGDRWIIDPIDGTKSFVAGVPLYSTLLSYEVDGVPEIGVAYFPALDEMVYAARGRGCYWNDVQCFASETSDMTRAVICTGSLTSLARMNRLDGVMDLGERCLAVRGWGDAYGHILVATGRAAAMIDPVVAHWDISAIQVIVEEAGGVFTDFEGEPILSNEAISACPNLHEVILDAFHNRFH